MPRNRYTRLIHSIEERQHARHEKELVALAQELRRPLVTQPEELPVTDIAKECRRIRRGWNLRHKPARLPSTPPQIPEPGGKAAAA